MKLIKTIIISTLSLFMLTAPAFAKTYKYTAQCNIQVIDPKIAPNPPPLRVTGSGTGNTSDGACAAAKKDATQKAPRGTYARHCQCTPA